ncbi:TraB/GumN family protein [Novosphingobium ginsenosidimutans]|uniref:TraB/GumN family protein n=1 Tax=Novosphingobium ginsenosidimutans TaxID=1176536 RepID=A0A5B8S6F8_9SPHN|nr:TraB/GumN family protein [Novosphingobium ginsenosidimutans]QEA17131.1 TraB/GumN family protein [Novosphingobium ginsenosidimutans]
MIGRFLAPLALLLSTAAPAQQSLPTEQPVVAEPVPAEVHPALWRVADEDTTIYLFGTIHLLPQGLNWFQGPLADAFAKADELVTEIPEIDPQTGQAVLLKRGILPAGQSLRDQMSPKQRTQFEKTLGNYGMPLAAFDRFKPWYAAVVLSTLPLQRKGYSLANGVEADLANRNLELKRPRIGLETLDYQLGLFDAFPAKVQRRYLFEVIAALPEIDKDVGEMVEAWRVGDAAKLATLMNADQDDPAMVKALLTNRNKAWAQWIKARLARPGVAFIAVGAGHLGGKGSVQDQLQALGVKSSRVQ